LLEPTPFTKGKFIRAAGAYATIAGRDESTGHVIIKMQSTEVRKFDGKCWATIGKVGNDEHMNVVIGKAGRQRWKGIKPHILGKNMNPVDHPHGGGEGHSSIGLRK
jgi:large subunit ribosomal protein L2